LSFWVAIMPASLVFNWPIASTSQAAGGNCGTDGGDGGNGGGDEVFVTAGGASSHEQKGWQKLISLHILWGYANTVDPTEHSLANPGGQGRLLMQILLAAVQPPQ